MKILCGITWKKVTLNVFILKKTNILLVQEARNEKKMLSDKPPMEAKLILFFIPHAGSSLWGARVECLPKRYEKEREWKKRGSPRVDEALFAVVRKMREENSFLTGFVISLPLCSLWKFRLKRKGVKR